MSRYASVLAILILAGVLTPDVRPTCCRVPRAYYDFEEVNNGTFQNVITTDVFDGHWVASGDTGRNAAIVSGLFGSGQALRFTSDQIARVPTLVTDTNEDRTDEDVFAGAFSVFVRVDTPNVAQMNMVNADRGPLTTTVRGWYLDFSNSTTNTAGEHLLRPRFTSGSGGPALHAGGTETTNYKNLESVGIIWNPDPVPGGSSEGSMAIYINGELYASQSHNWASVLVGEAGFNLGYGTGVSTGNGITIDDLAIWDVVLTSEDMLAIHTLGVPVPEPSIFVLLSLPGLLLAACRPPRRGLHTNATP